MSEKHTPGPWFVSGPFIGPRPSPDSSIQFKVARIAGDETDPEAIANAWLISAAPELLAVARNILDRGYVSKHIAEERDDHLALVAAIAKAEGQSPVQEGK